MNAYLSNACMLILLVLAVYVYMFVIGWEIVRAFSKLAVVTCLLKSARVGALIYYTRALYLASYVTYLKNSSSNKEERVRHSSKRPSKRKIALDQSASRRKKIQIN